MINVSEKIINKFFKIKEKQKDNQKENGVQVEKNNDIIMVDLGDGVKAKMSTSSLERVVKK
jgi:hypothetical protein